MMKRIPLGSKVKALPGTGEYPFIKKTEEELGYATVVSHLDRDRYKIQFDGHPTFIQSYTVFEGEIEVVSPAPRGWKHPKAPTLEEVKFFTDFLHGSGINYKWEIEETKTSFRASNAFDILTPDGFYEATVKFTVIFPKKASMYDFNVQFASGSQYQARKHIIREYLEDTMAYAIKQ